MAVLETTKGGYYLWNYIPSVPAAVIFILVFLAMTALISWRMFRTRTWFCVPFALGGFFEFVGYAARASAHDKTGKIMPYCIQSVLILLGPALFAASIYMCLGRIICGVRAERYSFIQPRKLTRTFVTGDVLSFVVQGGASGLMVTGSHATLGEGIVIAGLLIQVLMFGVFAVSAVVFWRRINRDPTPESIHAPFPWQKSMRMLFIVSGLIMLRSIFRVVEYAMGNSGYPLKNEWTLYIFDSVPMSVVMVIYYLWYPTRIASDKLEGQGFGI